MRQTHGYVLVQRRTGSVCAGIVVTSASRPRCVMWCHTRTSLNHDKMDRRFVFRSLRWFGGQWTLLLISAHPKYHFHYGGGNHVGCITPYLDLNHSCALWIAPTRNGTEAVSDRAKDIQQRHREAREAQCRRVQPTRFQRRKSTSEDEAEVLLESRTDASPAPRPQDPRDLHNRYLFHIPVPWIIGSYIGFQHWYFLGNRC